MTETASEWHQIYLGLGGNLGNRLANLNAAIVRLKAGGRIRLQAISRVYQTAPVGYTNQPPFLNIAVGAETNFEPRELLDYVKQLEIELEREPTFRNGPRPLDIDILFYADLRLEEEGLTIPHPRLTERGFVLTPLADLAPEWKHPLLGQSIEELLELCIKNTGEENGLPQGVEVYTAEPALVVPAPRLLFVTGRLAAIWLEDFVIEVGKRLAFEPVVAALELEVAAFMTARYVRDKLQLEANEWQKIDAMILPGFTSGDLKLVEATTKIRTVRGPNDLLAIEPFLAELLGTIRPAGDPINDRTHPAEAELRQMQARLTDANIRIYTDGERVYAFNHEVFAVAAPEERELRRLYRQLKISDAAHSYYLGREFCKAALSIKLGMRYRQDCDLEPLS